MTATGSALNTALAGLGAATAGIDIASRNIANANAVGYTRKVQTQTTAFDGAPSLGPVQRVLDAGLQKTSRDAASNVGMLDVQHRYASQITLKFGTPADTTSLSGLTSALGDAFRTLSASPETDASYTAVITAASRLAQGINTLYGQAEQVATNAKSELATTIDAANADLTLIDALNKKIITNTAGDVTELEDQRDQAIARLAEKLDITTFSRQDGGISVYTKNGTMLVDVEASTLSSEQVAGIGPVELVVQLAAGSAASTQVFPRSGAIKGLLDVINDQVPDLQAQLDNFATGLADATSNAAMLEFGAAPSEGDTVVVTLNDGTYNSTTNAPNPGAPLTFVFKTTPNPTDPLEVGIGATLDATLANLISAMEGQGISAAYNNDDLLVLSSQHGISIAGSTISVPASTYIAPVPLFDLPPSDPNPPNNRNLAGFGNTIAVNSLIIDTPTLLRDGSATTPLAPGDTRYIDAVGSVFQSNALAFPGISATNSLAGQASDIITGQSDTAATLDSLLKTETATQTAIDNVISSTSGVNLDTEFSHLLQLQQAYAASARIVTVTQNMFNTLLVAAGGTATS